MEIIAIGGVVRGLAIAASVMVPLGCGTGREFEVEVTGLDSLFGSRVCVDWAIYDGPSGEEIVREAGYFVVGSDASWKIGNAAGKAARMVADVWQQDNRECTNPCEVSPEAWDAGNLGENEYCESNYFGFSEIVDYPERTGKQRILDPIELRMLSIDELRPNQLWDKGTLRYIRNPWPSGATSDAEIVFDENPKPLSTDVTLDLVRSSFAVTRASIDADGYAHCDEHIIPQVSEGTTLDEAISQGTTPLVVSTAAICVAISTFHVWGPWDLVPLEFIVTYNEKRAQREYPNPNELAAFPELPVTMPQNLESHGGGDPGGVTRQDDGSMLCAFAEREWNSTMDTGPDPTDSPASIYDESTGNIYLFTGGAITPNVWERSEGAWELRNVTPCDPGNDPTSCPTSRTEFAVARDPESESLVLFGGRRVGFLLGEPEGGIRLGDLWSFTNRNSTPKWTPLLMCTADSTCPEPRSDHALERDVSGLLLFGGSGGTGGDLGDTWTWRGGTWNRHCADDDDCSKPEPRSGHAMAYDPRRGVVVLFGGRNGVKDLSDTWEWDGERWDERTQGCTPGESCPMPQRGHAMVYDGDLGRITLFGGAGDASAQYIDRWLWNGERWLRRIEACVEDRCPPQRSDYALAYDSIRKELLLFGGASDEQTWLLGEAAATQPAIVARIALWASELAVSTIASAHICIDAKTNDQGGFQVSDWDPSQSQAEWNPIFTSVEEDRLLRIDVPEARLQALRPLGDDPNDLPTANFAIVPQGERNTTVSADFLEFHIFYDPAEDDSGSEMQLKVEQLCSSTPANSREPTLEQDCEQI